MVKVLCYKSEGRRFDPSWCQLIFHWYKILPIAPWPWGRISLQQKWVPGVFPGGKGGRCVRLTTLPPPCAVFMKSGNLNLLEPSGTLQACNGTALHFLPFSGHVVTKTSAAISYVIAESNFQFSDTCIVSTIRVIIRFKETWWQTNSGLLKVTTSEQLWRGY